ncbi:MAG TPA: MJ0042-type zinc finger domain-containing protein, partial [Cellvibrio sp.]|nr:MJ0042-type zinc finger domain-containing protein [Cellvibrio sp.]
MTSASNQMITRCPKCGTAFRVTPSQLQSAKGAVRCGSCLNVFKAQEYLVASTTAPAIAKTVGVQTGIATATTTKPTATTALTGAKPGAIKSTPPSTPNQILASKPAPAATSQPSVSKPAANPGQPAILSTIKPLPIDTSKSLSAATASTAAVATTAVATAATKAAAARNAKPVIRTINKSSLGQADDILISDDMEDNKAESKNYEFDGFMDIDITPKSDVSLFERKIRDKNTEADASNTADESWAEMLIEDEDDTPQLGILKPKS